MCLLILFSLFFVLCVVVCFCLLVTKGCVGFFFFFNWNFLLLRCCSCVVVSPFCLLFVCTCVSFLFSLFFVVIVAYLLQGCTFFVFVVVVVLLLLLCLFLVFCD